MYYQGVRERFVDRSHIKIFIFRKTSRQLKLTKFCELNIIYKAARLHAHLVINVVLWFWVYHTCRFYPFKENPDEEYQSLENTAVFNVSSFQYIILAVMFAPSAPFRKNLLSNIPFLVNVLLCVAVAIWLIIYPTGLYTKQNFHFVLYWCLRIYDYCNISEKALFAYCHLLHL